MDYDDVAINEGIPVMLFLKGSNAPNFGIYHFKKQNKDTIILEDRDWNKTPIDISLIGAIKPVEAIKYTRPNPRGDPQ